MSNPPIKKFYSRRDFVSFAVKLAIFGGMGGVAACSSALFPAEDDREGLGYYAASQGRLFGAALQSSQLSDADFRQALSHQVTLIVPETELKWDILRPTPDSFDFRGYYRLRDYATSNRIEMRGHTLVWHDANPDWLQKALLRRDKAEKILEEHIFRVVRETASLVRNWDVVNEAVHPRSTRDDGLRETLWLNALGPEYISLAFQMAHAADNDLTLVYNDYGTEHGDGDGKRKRSGILRLLEKLRHDGVPVNAFGLQSHLEARRPLGGQSFKEFLKEVRDLGLNVIITELDLNLDQLTGRADDKIKIAQNYVKSYLNMVQEGGSVDMLLTWGLSDRYSWLHTMEEDTTGALPLDRNLGRNALWYNLRENWLRA